MLQKDKMGNTTSDNDLMQTVSQILTVVTQVEHKPAVEEALDILLNEFQSERIFIGDFIEEKNRVNFFYSRNREDTIPISEDLKDLLLKGSLPWWISSLKSGKDIIISDISEIPVEAEQEKDIFPTSNIKSTLAMPTYYGGEINGFIGIDHVNRQRTWDKPDIDKLRMFAHIISIVIEHNRLQKEVAISKKETVDSDRKFQTIFDELNTGIIILDDEGYVSDINKAGIEIFGTTREELMGLDIMKCPALPADLVESMAPGYAEEEYNKTFPYDFDIIRATNYYKTTIKGIRYLRIQGMTMLDEQNEIIGFIAIMIDDTDDYLKNEMIQANLAKLKAAINTGESLIWEYDIMTDTFTVEFTVEENNASEDIEFLKTHPIKSMQEYLDTVFPDDQELVYSQFNQLKEGKLESFTIVYRRIIANRFFWFQSNVRTYKYNEDGTPLKIVSYTTNISKIREQEIELVKVKEADKLKSAFMANMSHEIRTPLNAIVGFSNILAEENRNEENDYLIELINKNNDILLNLVDDILDFSKIESGTLEYNMTDVDMKTICEEIVYAFASKVPKELSLSYDSSIPSCILHTDEKRVKQVLSNLINNAIKFTEKGSITISYHETEDHMLMIKVSDTGIGISHEDREHVFDRFYKADSFQQGVGLGLTISRTIIETLGGMIGVDSEKGKGTTFWFTLPTNK